MKHTNDQTITAYDKSIKRYVESTPQKVDGHIKIWLDKCLSQIDKTAKILEVGVGHGKDSDYIESKGFSVERTDASEGFLDYQKQLGRKARKLNVLTDEINDSYDMILADAVLLHFNKDEIRSVLAKVFSALKNNGIFAFSLKEGEGEEVTDRKLGHMRYFHFWKKAEIHELLKETGFIGIDIEEANDYRPDRPGWLHVITKKVAA